MFWHFNKSKQRTGRINCRLGFEMYVQGERNLPVQYSLFKKVLRDTNLSKVRYNTRSRLKKMLNTKSLSLSSFLREHFGKICPNIDLW